MNSNFLEKVGKNPMNKKGQVTVFIIIGVILLAGIIIYFLIAQRTGIIIPKPTISEPETYIEKCARDAASDSIDIMLPQGGWITPKHYMTYKNDTVQFLCYTNLYYKTCTNQEPMYIEHLEKEITTAITDKVDRCFNELKSGLTDEGYSVDMGSMNMSTYLSTGIVRINIERKFSMTRNQETRNFDKFKAVFNSPLYKLGVVALEVANQEAKYCNFEYVGFMLLYPEFSIDKKFTGSGTNVTKFYFIKDVYSGKQLNIAIRSCAFPEGF